VSLGKLAVVGLVLLAVIALAAYMYMQRAPTIGVSEVRLVVVTRLFLGCRKT